MTDLTLIERDIRRILNSHWSMAQRTSAAEKLFERVNGLHTSIPNAQTKSQFRADYKALVGRTFGQSPDATGSKARVAALFLDHARKLEEIESTREKLNRELGDF